MANGPLGGFMPTPAAPAQPPQVKFATTANSRGNFNNFLKNMNGATSLNPPVMAPAMGAMAPNMAPAANIDIFNQPVSMMQQGGNVPPRNTNIMGQPHMLAYITPQEGQLLENLGGANEPGPMGIPSFFDTGEGNFGYDMGSVEGGDPGDPGAGDQDTGSSDVDNIDTSAPDSDIDYTDSTTTSTESDRDTDSEFGDEFDVVDPFGVTQAKVKNLLNETNLIPGAKGFKVGETTVPTLMTGINKLLSGATDMMNRRIYDGITKKGQTPVYDPVTGRITGSRDAKTGILMEGMDFSDQQRAGDGDGDNIVGGDLLAKEASPEKPKKDSLPNIIGGITGQLGNIMPIGQSPIVASPFTTATPTSQIDPITFDSANLNKLIEMLTGVPSKPITAKQDGGLVAAVDEFLASGQ